MLDHFHFRGPGLNIHGNSLEEAVDKLNRVVNKKYGVGVSRPKRRKYIPMGSCRSLDIVNANGRIIRRRRG